MIKNKFLWLGLVAIVTLALVPGCYCSCGPEEEEEYQQPAPTEEVRASAAKTPSSLAEGETSTFTIQVTNDSSKDLEIKEITIEWWWEKPGEENQLHETEKLDPDSDGWQTSKVNAGVTKTVYTKQEEVGGVGNWYGAVSIMTTDDVIYTDVDLTVQ